MRRSRWPRGWRHKNSRFPSAVVFNILARMNPKRIVLVGIAISALIFSTGCCCTKKTTATPAQTSADTTSSSAVAPSTVASQTVAASVPASVPTAIRIKAGLATALTNSDGTVWLADQDFADGETIERPDAQIANTTEPAVYQSERYSMTSFSRAVPNGKYIVKLHFAETYEGVTGAGQRVFTFNVQGHEFKDFDVFAKA